VLDGFPRTVSQAELFSKTAAGLQLDKVVSLVLPEDELVDRLGGRLTCLACGASYHIRYRPPRAEGVCDECGHDLVKRADDEPDAIRQRLKVYHAKTEPLIVYYRDLNKLIELDATGAADVVFARLVVELKFDVAKNRIR
jgi:adenylate kinase